MFKTFANAWKLTDLRKKILFTFLIIVLYRVGVAIPIPYLNPAMLGEIAKMAEGSIFQYLNILSGNAFSQATLFVWSDFFASKQENATKRKNALRLNEGSGLFGRRRCLSRRMDG